MIDRAEITGPQSLFGAGWRVRLTTHLPINGTRIGLVVWVGSIERGWVGKHVNPFKWNRTWRITGTTEVAEIAGGDVSEMQAPPPVSLSGDELSGVADRCFCPHAGPCCHSDHGCCGGCADEAERREQIAEREEDDGI